MTDWSEMTLGEAGVSLIDCVHKTPMAQSDGYPYVGIPQMKSGHIAFGDARRITTADYEEWTKKAKPQAFDVILSRRTNPGVVAVDRTNTPFALGQNLVLLRSNGETVYPPFLRWLCLSPQWWEQIEKFINVGAVFSSLRCADVPKFALPIPPIQDQREIADLLGALDDKIELNRRMSVSLEDMARALYRSWFVEFDPVHARALGHPPTHMDATTAALFPDSFGLDGLPKGWETCPLSEVCTQVKKTVRPMAAPDAEFLHFSLPAFDADRMPVREKGAAIKSNKAHVPHDAILFSRLNPSIPRVWWAKTKAMDGTPAASTEFFVAAAHDPVETSWLYCLLSSSDFRDEALSRVTGTSNSHQRIPPKALAEIEVIAPQPEVVEAFGELSGPWFEKVHTMAQENQTLAALRDALIPRLMSGELRIREAEKQVEEVV